MALLEPFGLQRTFRLSIFLVILFLFVTLFSWIRIQSQTDLTHELYNCNGINKEAKTSSKTKSDYRLCVIIPFRDRLEELQIFAPHLDNFLSNQCIDYRLLIMNQADQYRFNRASLINVGYFESKRMDCDYLSMHDVDLLPINRELSYHFPQKGPFHLASPDYHPRYHYKRFVGGIMLMTLDHFKKTNGLSNKYWGWGMEDDEFYLRIKQANLTIYRPINLSSTVNDTFKHIHDRRFRIRDMQSTRDQRKASRKRDRFSGINTIKYHIISRVPMRIQAADITVINVQLYCNLKWTPWCKDANRYFEGQFFTGQQSMPKSGPEIID